MIKSHLLHHVGMLEATLEELLHTYEKVYVLNNAPISEWHDILNFIVKNWEHGFTNDSNFNYKLRAFAIRLKEMSEKYTDGKRELINNTLFYTDHFWRFRWGEDEWRINPTRMVNKHYGWEIHPYYTDIVRKNFWFLNDLFNFNEQNYAKINKNTFLVYRYTEDYPENMIYQLGDIKFTHGVVVGYDHNGIQDCPYTKESLKFLIKKGLTL